MQLLAIGDYCLMEEVEHKDRVTASGIVIAGEKKKNETGKGIIKALGTTEQEHVKVGDVVYFNKYIPQEVTINDERVLMIAYKDILAKEV